MKTILLVVLLSVFQLSYQCDPFDSGEDVCDDECEDQSGVCTYQGTCMCWTTIQNLHTNDMGSDSDSGKRAVRSAADELDLHGVMSRIARDIELRSTQYRLEGIDSRDLVLGGSQD